MRKPVAAPAALTRVAVAALVVAAISHLVPALAASAGPRASASAPTPRQLARARSAAQRGHEALARGDLSRASQYFEASLATVPGDPDARLGLGHVAYRREMFAAALSHYTAARDAYLRLGGEATAARYHRYVAAQRRLRVLEDDLRTLRGGSRAPAPGGLRDLEREIERLRALPHPVGAPPAAAPAPVYYFRGNALFRLGRTDEAIADWETCAGIDPGRGAVHNNLAVARFALGHLLLARAELDAARRLGAPVDPHFEARLAEASTLQAGADLRP